MDIITCEEVAFMVIEEATKQFGSLWKESKEKSDILKQYCEKIDEFVEEFGGSSIEVEVDEITMEIKISIECPDITVKDKNHFIYELFKRTTKFGFSTSEDGNIILNLVFPSIWEKA